MMRGTVQDITERKQAELALKRSETRFRNIMEYAPIGMSTTSMDGHFLLFNQALCDMIGYSMAELHKMSYQDITHPEDQALTVGDRKKLLGGEIEVYHKEKRYFHKSGRVVWVRVTSSCVINESGAQPYIIAQIEDITERKLAEIKLLNSQAMLKKSREHLSAFIRHAPISIAMFDREMNYLVVSDRWLLEHGQKEADIIGRNHYVIEPDIPAKWKDNHQKGLAGVTLKNDEDMWIRADGSVHCMRWALQPWFDEQGFIGGIPAWIISARFSVS